MKLLRKRKPTIATVKGTTGISYLGSYVFKSQFTTVQGFSRHGLYVCWELRMRVFSRVSHTVTLCLLNSTDAVECLGLSVYPLIAKCGCSPQCGSQHWQGQCEHHSRCPSSLGGMTGSYGISPFFGAGDPRHWCFPDTALVPVSKLTKPSPMVF